MLKFTALAAAELLQEHRKELHGYLVRRIHCPETASDILQDAYLRIVHSQTPGGIKNPRAFLYRVVSNLAIDYQRSSKRRSTCYDDDHELAEQADPAPPVDHLLYTQERIAHLRLAVSELPPRCREVFILHKFKHYPYSAIMNQFGISESTVLKHLVKAMEHCRRRMQELDASGEQNVGD